MKIYDEYREKIEWKEWPAVGEIFVCKSSYPESWVVAVHGDGTLMGDTVCRGIFWERGDAVAFAQMLDAPQVANENRRRLQKEFEASNKDCPDCGNRDCDEITCPCWREEMAGDPGAR